MVLGVGCNQPCINKGWGDESSARLLKGDKTIFFTPHINRNQNVASTSAVGLFAVTFELQLGSFRGLLGRGDA